MGIYSVWPFFVAMLVLFGLASTRLTAWADTPPSATPERVVTLDGLRGFLALGVFFHHTAVYQAYLAGHVWAVPPSRFYALIGQVGVALFFMLTGFLFWSRLLKGRPDWISLYIGRLFRIGPLYLVLFAAICLIAIARTGGLHPAALDPGSVARWSALGFVQGGNINGYSDTGMLTAGVTWTLHYEWLFYLALLPLSLMAGRFHLAASAGAVVLAFAGLALFRDLPFVCAALFSLGMLTGSLQRYPLPRPPPSWATSTLVVVLLAAAVTAFRTAYTPPAMLLLGAAFYLVASGCSVFGLLTSRPAVRLGDVSFGIYLLQGLVLTLMFVGTPLGPLSLGSPALHWGLMTMAGVVLVLVATGAHAMIERPGIALGKRLRRRIAA